MTKKKLKRTDYDVALVSPLSDVEVLPSRLMMDEEHDAPLYDVNYDDNIYIFGSISGHNVVLASCPPGMTGNLNAGRLVEPMMNTFPNIRMTLLVGIGGGIPRSPPPKDATKDVHLGDVVVGWPADGGPACIHYDFGRWHSDGKFGILGTIDKPQRVLLSALGKLQNDHRIGSTSFEQHRQRLLQPKHKREFTRPNLDQDRLFESSYDHQGQYNDGCEKCDTAKLVKRPERTVEGADMLVFHCGRIASGNAVVMDAVRRDSVRDLTNGALCIEMEAAGVDAKGSCLVIRGISDYSDPHKSDAYRSYAAGNAAIFARELLSKIPHRQEVGMQSMENAVLLAFPFARNKYFCGRSHELQELERHRLNTMDQRLAIFGLAGSGKSALAIEFAYRVREKNPQCQLFWVPAITLRTFEEAYNAIGKALEIPEFTSNQISNDIDVKELIKDKLNDPRSGPWLMVVDNTDDDKVLLDPLPTNPERRLMDYLPQHQGFVLFTTRTQKIAYNLAGTASIKVGKLPDEEGRAFVEKRLPNQTLVDDDATVKRFLDKLAHHPLAIVQAMAYIVRNTCTLKQYLDLFDQRQVEFLRRKFTDETRYQNQGEITNEVATTFHVSFNQMRKDDPLAAEWLIFMACLQHENIPLSILPPEEDTARAVEAIGTLKAYGFVTPRVTRRLSDVEAYDMHQLVQLATHEWMQGRGEWEERVGLVMDQMCDKICVRDDNIMHSLTCIEHAIRVVDLGQKLKSFQATRALMLHIIGVWQLCSMQFHSAERSLREASSLLATEFGPGNDITMLATSELGVAIFNRGDHSAGEALQRKTLALAISIRGQQHPVTIGIRRNLVRICRDLAGPVTTRAKLNEAETLTKEVLNARRGALGEEHVFTLETKKDLAAVCSSQGRYQEAEKLLRENLVISTKLLGETNTSTLETKQHLADALRAQGDHKRAEEELRYVLAQIKEVRGTKSLEAIRCMSSLAMAIVCQGNYREAISILREEVAVATQVLGEKHAVTLRVRETFAKTLGRQGEHRRAAEELRSVLELRQDVNGREAPETLRCMRELAIPIWKQRKHNEAEKILRSALSLYQRHPERDGPGMADCMSTFQKMLREQGKHDKADEKEQQRLALGPRLRKTLGLLKSGQPGKGKRNWLHPVVWLTKFHSSRRKGVS